MFIVLMKLNANNPIIHARKDKMEREKNSPFKTSLPPMLTLLEAPKKIELNKFTEQIAPKTILNKINIVNHRPFFELNEALKAKSSPQKFNDPGIDMFAKVNTRKIDPNIGIEEIRPL